MRLVMIRYLGVVLATIFVVNAALLWRSTVEDCISECGTPSFGFLAGTLLMTPFLVVGVGLILWAPRITR
jgi:hypothetical protein